MNIWRRKQRCMKKVGIDLYLPPEAQSETFEVSRIGTVVEHPNGTIDIYDWDFDCGCPSIDVAVKMHRHDLIRLAKEIGTYRFEGG